MSAPRWSVMVPCYNGAVLLRQTLESLMAQNLGEDQMHIEVIDDASDKEDLRAVVDAVGGGRIHYYSQRQNVGVTRNFNTCLERAQGEWVHILHGDDYALPDMYASLDAIIDRHPEVESIVCRASIVDGDSKEIHLGGVQQEHEGMIRNWIDVLATKNTVVFPTIVIKRSVFAEVGAFDVRLKHAGDWDMWKRVGMRGTTWFTPKVLCAYRVHAASDTSKLAAEAKNIVDIRLAIDIAEAYLPAEKAVRLSQQARREVAEWALWTANEFIGQKKYASARQQLYQAARTSTHVLQMEPFWRLLRGAVL